MGKRGPAPHNMTPQDMRRKINEYFEDCAYKNTFPDEAGMRNYLQIYDQKELERYAESGPDAATFKKIFAWAKNTRESWLARKAASDPKAANGCVKLLMQKGNGGYSDGKEKGDGRVEVVIKADCAPKSFE